MEYPHWLMVAGALLVVARFLGLGFSWYMNRAGRRQSAPRRRRQTPRLKRKKAHAVRAPRYGNRRMMISCERWQRWARALPRLHGYSNAVLRPSESAPRFSE
jgi:hypothetical protein